MLNSIFRYFDLASEARSVAARSYSGGKKAAHVLPQYGIVSIGVIVEPYLRGYIAAGHWQVDWAGIWGRVVFGLLIGIIILPAIYKSSFDPDKPVLVQLAALFPLGIGWQSLVATAAKAIAPPG